MDCNNNFRFSFDFKVFQEIFKKIANVPHFSGSFINEFRENRHLCSYFLTEFQTEFLEILLSLLQFERYLLETHLK